MARLNRIQVRIITGQAWRRGGNRARGIHPGSAECTEKNGRKLFLKTFTADDFADDGAEFEIVLGGVLDDLIHGEGVGRGEFAGEGKAQEMGGKGFCKAFVFLHD